LSGGWGVKAALFGVDLGTMGTKAALVDEEGRVLAEAYKEVGLRYPRPGWVEQDLEEIYASALEVIRTCLEQSGINPSQVQALAFDGQMSGLGAVDPDGQPAIPFDSWLDTRCAPYIELLKAHEEEIIRSSGGPPSFSHGAKILWWMREAPEAFQRVAKFLVPAGYVALRMVGLRGEDAFIDWTYIHFSVFSDLLAKDWNLDLLQAYGLPKEKLPRIVDPWSIVGGVSKEAARATGLREGTPIVAGCGDQAATMLGAGIARAGLVLNVLGTASVFAATSATYTPDIQGRTFFTARLPLEGLFYQIAFINGGGLNLRWFRDEILACEKEQLGKDFYVLYSELAGKIPPGSQGLLFLPHLGGRVTPSVPHLRGALLGLNWGHGRPHIYRALLEGVAYEFALYMADLARQGQVYSEARAIGGGARSAAWVQILADVLGLPYLRLQREEFAAYGSALLAGHAIGLFPDLAATAEKFAEVRDRFLPRPEAHRIYRSLAELYRQFLEVAEDFSRKLLQLTSGGEG